jgi:hypothetical protein
MFFQGSYYYYITIGLQIICAVHSINRGTQNKWIWIIIFLPVIGSLIYLYSEVLANRRFSKPDINVGAIINPGGKLKKLEDEVKFTDTFANRIKLADAYLDAGMTDRAIELYTTSLTGAFAENEHVLAQLVIAYFRVQRYDDAIATAKKIYKLPQFIRSKAHIAYAQALELAGNTEQAENEFKVMKGRYSYYGPRYEYGLFLVRAGRDDEAAVIFQDMLTEEPQLSSVEKKSNRVWFSKAKDELRKL